MQRQVWNQDPSAVDMGKTEIGWAPVAVEAETDPTAGSGAEMVVTAESGTVECWTED